MNATKLYDRSRKVLDHSSQAEIRRLYTIDAVGKIHLDTNAVISPEAREICQLLGGVFAPALPNPTVHALPAM